MISDLKVIRLRLINRFNIGNDANSKLTHTRIIEILTHGTNWNCYDLI